MRHSHRPVRRRGILTLLCLVAILLGPLSARHAVGEETKEDMWTQVKKLYEKAKAAGDKVPSDVREWVMQDVQNMSKWEYRVETMPASGDQPVSKRLNELGLDNWECFHIDREVKSVTLYYKRHFKSYLQLIPVRDLLKLLGSS